MISLGRGAHPGLDELQRTMMSFDRRVASQAANIATAKETVRSLVGRSPLTPGDRQRLYSDVMAVEDSLWTILYKDLAEKIGCAGPTGGQPTISMPDGRVVSAVDVLLEILDLTADEERRIAIFATIARHAHSDIVIRTAETAVIRKSKSDGVRGDEARDSIVDVVHVPATIMGLREAFKQHFRSPLYPGSPMAIWQQDCETLFAYVVRFLPTVIELHLSRFGVGLSLTTTILVTETLFKASHWHLMYADRGTAAFSRFLANEGRRSECEKKWQLRVVDVVRDTVQLLLNDNRLFSEKSTWKPVLFDRLRDEMTGTGRQRDHEGNQILRDSYGRVPVGFPPEWADSGYARMCAVFGAVNAVFMVEQFLRDQEKYGTRYLTLMNVLVSAAKQLGIAYMTSYTTCVEIVAFCVIRLIAVCLSDVTPSALSDVREQTVRCLGFLLGVYDSEEHDPALRTILDSCTFWPVDDLPEVVVEWKGAESSRALCMAFLLSVRRNRVADFCRSLVVQLQH